MSPELSCLEIRTAGNDDPAATGGCVNPTLVGVNRCSEALVFPARVAGDGVDGASDVSFPPGQSFSFEVDSAAAKVGGSDDMSYYAVPATVGDKAITISFEAR